MVQAHGVVSGGDGETIQMIPASADVFQQSWCYIRAGAPWQGKHPSPESPWEPQVKMQSLMQVQVVPVLGAAPAVLGTRSQHKPTMPAGRGSRQEGEARGPTSTTSLEPGWALPPA